MDGDLLNPGKLILRWWFCIWKESSLLLTELEVYFKNSRSGPRKLPLPVSSSCSTRMSYSTWVWWGLLSNILSFLYVWVPFGTESVQAGSAKISKTLAPLNIHYYWVYFKDLLFQCFTLRWWTSCWKLLQPGPWSSQIFTSMQNITHWDFGTLCKWEQHLSRKTLALNQGFIFFSAIASYGS